jgi:hypothetical protein
MMFTIDVLQVPTTLASYVRRQKSPATRWRVAGWRVAGCRDPCASTSTPLQKRDKREAENVGIGDLVLPLPCTAITNNQVEVVQKR